MRALALLLLLAACKRDEPAPPAPTGPPVAAVDGILRRDGRIYRMDEDALRRSDDGDTWTALPRPNPSFVPHWLDDDAWAMGAPAAGQPRRFHVWDGTAWRPGAPYPEGIYAIGDWRREPDGWRILAETDRGDLVLLTLDPAMAAVEATALKALTPRVAPPGLPEATIALAPGGTVRAAAFRRDGDGRWLELHDGARVASVALDELPGEHRAVALTDAGAPILDERALATCTPDGCARRPVPVPPRAVGLRADGDRVRVVLALAAELLVLAPDGPDRWTRLAVHPLADETEPDGLYRVDGAWVQLR